MHGKYIYYMLFIKQSTTGVKTTFGKFTKKCKPGLAFYIPIVEKIHIVSNKLFQDSFRVETKTKNDVFVKIGITIEYIVKEDDSDKALFSMDDPIKQINNTAENVLITSTSKMDLNTLFESRDELCKNVVDNLKEMENNGYTIIKTLVTSIDVDNSVRDALNKVYESKKILEATKNNAEAEKIKLIKAAEAEKESKILQGQGSAGQRDAILEGFSQNVKNFREKFGISPEKIFQFVLNVQHLDMLKDVGSNSKSNVIFLNHEAQQNNLIKGLFSKTDHMGPIENLDEHSKIKNIDEDSKNKPLEMDKCVKELVGQMKNKPFEMDKYVKELVGQMKNKNEI